MLINEDEYLAHYGILRRSGRYPYGSGGPERAGDKAFLDYVATLKGKGLSETEIARGMGITTTQLRAARTIAKNTEKQAQITNAQRLKDKGMSNVAIGKQMGIPESSVRALLAPGAKDKAAVLNATANMLKEEVKTKQFVDIGSGVENHLGISETKLAAAVASLKEEGYTVHKVKVEQAGTGFKTEVRVLAPPGTTQKEVWLNREKIQQHSMVQKVSGDGGRNFYGLHDPLSVSSKRIDIAWKEDGGADLDGVIYVRPGVKDLSMGGNNYAQVRIKVDGTHYLKGMAMYKDDLPDGTDIVFNTNKPRSADKLSAMKPLKDDPDNPFGSIVNQIGDLDAHGRVTNVTSAMNIVNAEGDWGKWSKTLSSQMLSKQSPILAKQQLDMTYESRKNQLDEILSLTNPAVRRTLLEDFAENADSAAVHLKAAALPRQATHVILPINTLKETEIYAPNYRNGEQVVLIRFPHGGTFEIPELTVNNRHRDSRRALGNTPDAVGINSEVAKRLSGADFDGDTVLVIPQGGRTRVKTSPALEGLKDFDPMIYKDDSIPKLKPERKQQLMGDVSNLITDMTIKGANHSELARAVRHSMVVIDAEKHGLDYKRSAIDNGIANLKRTYQGSARSGASTIVSRKKSPMFVPERKQGFRIDPETGRKIFSETGATRTDAKGRVVPKTTRVKKLAETDNAHTLSSGTPIEKVYADHSNRLKSLANQARKEAVHTKPTPYSPSAKEVYSTEVSSLNHKLNIALRNRPLERQAQILSEYTIQAKRRANPDMDPAELKKIKSQALAEARTRTGARKERVEITDREWEAIQAGAISNHKLMTILKNSDLDQVKKLATPRTNKLMTSTKRARAKQMLASGYTQAEVADHLGVSLTTLKTSLGGS